VSTPAVPKLLLSGLDSLYVAYFFIPGKSKIDWEDLAYRKELLKANSKVEGAEIRLGCQRFMLQAYGSKPYTYVLRNREFVIRLGENISPCCHVQFLSEGLWHHGIKELRRRFDLWALSVGFEFTRDPVVSRADWAFDFRLKEIDFNEDSFVSLAEKDSKHRGNRKPQTFTFGKGEKVARVYDKVVEIKEESGKTWFYELWNCREDVWRVEFQVRGEALKAYGIRTLPDLFLGQAALLRDLALNHTSLRCASGDSNRSRWPLHPLWEAVLAAIAAFPHQVRLEVTGTALPVRIRIGEQEKSLYGHMKSFGALWTILENREHPLTLEETITRLRTGLAMRHHESAEWNAEIEDRRKRHELGEW
jgi:hypothetical protein